jgi:hypothetical protein
MTSERFVYVSLFIPNKYILLLLLYDKRMPPCPPTLPDSKRTFCTCVGVYHCCCNGRFDVEIADEYKDKLHDDIYTLLSDLRDDLFIELLIKPHCDIPDKPIYKLTEEESEGEIRSRNRVPQQ